MNKYKLKTQNRIIHRAASLQELDDMLKEYDMKRDSVEINHDAPRVPSCSMEPQVYGT